MAKVANGKRIYKDVEEAKAHPRHGKTKDGKENPWSIWCIASPTGERWFTWSGSQGVALSQCVQDLGWTCYLAEGKGSSPALQAARDENERLKQELEALKEQMKAPKGKK